MSKSTATSYMLLVFALLAIFPASSQVVTTAQYCGNSVAGGHTAINRLWQSPPNIPALVLQGATFIDDSFKGSAALYNNDLTTYSAMQTVFEGNTASGNYFWKRYITQYP